MKTILVVDDQLSVCQLLQDFLQVQGFRVITTAGSQDALRQARQENPDLILLDIQMPGMDGYEFLRTIRQERQTPVILTTAREEEADVVLGLELGADDCLFKPIRMRELLARINAILRRNRRSARQTEVLSGNA